MVEIPPDVDETSDDALIDQVRTGSREAQEELFRRHFGVCFRVAVRLLGQHEDAQDAVQEGYLKAVRHLADFDGRSEFRTWLLRIVTNAALDLGRQRRRRPTVRLGNPEDGTGGPAVTHDPAQGLDREDLRRMLTAALDRLSPPIRATFVLFAEAGLSYKEIARSQGVPIGTVMSRMNFARQKMQAWLQPVLAQQDGQEPAAVPLHLSKNPTAGAARCDATS